MLIDDIMTVNVRTVSQDDSLGEVDKIFKTVGYHHLLVVDNTKLIGVLSDRDVIRQLSPFIGSELEEERDREVYNKKVQSFMSTDIITIEPDASIDYASILLLEHVISCLPVVDKEYNVKGIVTWKDMLKYYVYSKQA